MAVFDLFKPNVEKIAKERDVDGLVKALKDEDGDVRKEASEALCKIRDGMGLESLIQALEVLDAGYSWIAREALVKKGEPAVEPLIQALKDKHPGVREAVAEALGEIGDVRAVDPLIQLLKDENDLVRMCAARSLGQIRDTKAAEPLIQALTDRDVRVKEQAAKALGNIGDTKAMEQVAQLLRDKNIFVRLAASMALDELGWKPPNDVDKAHFLIAKRAWGELVIMGEPAVDPLTHALEDESEKIRESATETLRMIRVRKAIMPLKQRLVHVIIYTEEPFEANEANVAGCVASAFPEEVQQFDPVKGSFTLREKKFGYSIFRTVEFKDPEMKNGFISWMKSLGERVHDLPRRDEIHLLMGTSDWGAIYLSVMLERVNPEFASNIAFIRKWAAIGGKILVTGVFSIVPHEPPTESSTLPPPPPPP